MISASPCSRCAGIGAPAEKKLAAPAIAARPASSSSPAVSRMFRSAAGAVNTAGRPSAPIAAASAGAVSSPGRVMSMSGTTVGAPRAGPSSAKVAKPATRPRSGARSRVSPTAANMALSWRCVMTAPLAGPVEPEVNSTAASESGSGWATSSGAPSSRWRAPERASSAIDVSTPSAARSTVGSCSTLIRRPGQPIARAPTRAFGMPISQSMWEPITARVRPWVPRPASATTATAPIRKQA